MTSREVAEAVLKTHDTNFASRPEMAAPKIIGYGCTDIAFSPYGAYWRQLRKICVMELLSAKRVKSFSSLRTEEIAGFLKDIAGAAARQTPVNLSLMLMSLANNIVCRYMWNICGQGMLRYRHVACWTWSQLDTGDRTS